MKNKNLVTAMASIRVYDSAEKYGRVQATDKRSTHTRDQEFYILKGRKKWIYGVLSL
jgi:hypothetical protein